MSGKHKKTLTTTKTKSRRKQEPASPEAQRQMQAFIDSGAFSIEKTIKKQAREIHKRQNAPLKSGCHFCNNPKANMMVALFDKHTFASNPTPVCTPCHRAFHQREGSVSLG